MFANPVSAMNWECRNCSTHGLPVNCVRSSGADFLSCCPVLAACCAGGGAAQGAVKVRSDGRVVYSECPCGVFLVECKRMGKIRIPAVSGAFVYHNIALTSKVELLEVLVLVLVSVNVSPDLFYLWHSFEFPLD